ncbi:hypothetical protein MKQ70_00870 [Chitinophaga sedimenti]|uniref:hypothetical protein n=1 Tax=Chitinophaga sedimenti TaxID=2033606 RepID=UPI002003D55A|nr:hypothetical protein [Chitinophaga sedimenti]MCK7553631.1 hypothetical protein [Chitinophaga sedimenti]
MLAVLEAPEISSQLSGADSRLQALQALYTASKANYDRLLETSKTPGTISPNDRTSPTPVSRQTMHSCRQLKPHTKRSAITAIISRSVRHSMV